MEREEAGGAVCGEVARSSGVRALPVRASEQVETDEGLNLEWPSFVEEARVCMCMYIRT